MKEEYLIILLIGIVLPIIFSPVLIGAVQDDSIGIVVEFEYPKNQVNLKSDTENQFVEIFVSDKPTIIDSALLEFFASNKPVLTDSILIETFDNEQSTLEFDTQVSILITDKNEVVMDEQF